jgi:dihydrofolate reductase
MDPDIDFNAMMDAFDTIFLGRVTYDATREYAGGAMPGMKSYVFSTTLRQDDCPGVIVSPDPQQTLSNLRQQKGKDIWLFGGGKLFHSLLDLGLVDSIEVAIIPILLGCGLPLLPHPSKNNKLQLTSHRVYEKTGTVALEYRPKR